MRTLLFSWEYNDKSNPKVPNRDIDWCFKIPFLLKVRGSNGWTSFIGSVRLLIFGVSYVRHLYTGNQFNFQLWPWTLEFRIGWGYKKSHLFTFWVGFSKAEYLDWKIRRTIKKMTPEKRKELRQIFDDLLGKSGTQKAPDLTPFPEVKNDSST